MLKILIPAGRPPESLFAEALQTSQRLCMESDDEPIHFNVGMLEDGKSLRRFIVSFRTLGLNASLHVPAYENDAGRALPWNTIAPRCSSDNSAMNMSIK